MDIYIQATEDGAEGPGRYVATVNLDCLGWTTKVKRRLLGNVKELYVFDSLAPQVRPV